ncbi:hypothetical protein DUNSADRAFT_8396 [Dunaliella salina]|uniref:Ubiquitin-like domain-containing protein n=1 Tax=Dunaliella salina TaxID=3046 RepID=A0ABQ7GJM4_DUNSA|nr:hypothetical protein DUNSADRAFT_8396 [Dunaliella salina]|eukprot:KAF5834812.1 hypothetical protein DUNSADRAFT_8396 [Dunaliella salina]
MPPVVPSTAVCCVCPSCATAHPAASAPPADPSVPSPTQSCEHILLTYQNCCLLFHQLSAVSCTLREVAHPVACAPPVDPSLPILPPVPSHRASFRGQPVMLDVQWHTPATVAAAAGAAGCPQHQHQQAGGSLQHRARMPASSTDYVGVVRQRVGEVVGLPASSLRLLCAGHEWADDAMLLSKVVPRAALAASVSGRAPSITVAPRGGGTMPMDPIPGWPESWKSTPMGLLSTKVSRAISSHGWKSTPVGLLSTKVCRAIRSHCSREKSPVDSTSAPMG